MQTTCLPLRSGKWDLSAHAKQPARCRRASKLIVRADDDEMLPLVRLPKHGFSDKDYEKMAHPHLLGGATIGRELELLRAQYVKAEANAELREKDLVSANWDGDVYIGSRWNTLSILYLIFLLTPIFGLMFAFMSYGKLWGVVDYYNYTPF